MPKRIKIEYPVLTPTKRRPEAHIELKGVIINRAITHYNRLPKNVKQWLSQEDFVQEAMFFATKILLQRFKHYDPARSSWTTLIHASLDNYFRGMVSIFYQPKKEAPTISFDEDRNAQHIPDSRSLTVEEVTDAITVVKRLHRTASIELISFLDAALFSHTASKVITHGQRFHRLAQEFRELARRYGVTIDHYRIVLVVEASMAECLCELEKTKPRKS